MGGLLIRCTYKIHIKNYKFTVLDVSFYIHEIYTFILIYFYIYYIFSYNMFQPLILMALWIYVNLCKNYKFTVKNYKFTVD